MFTGTITTDIIDHLANFIILPPQVSKPACLERPLTRIFSTANKTLFNEELSNIDWNTTVYNCLDVDVAYNNFVSIISKAFNKCFPLIPTSRKRCKDKKWVTPGIKKSSETKTRLYKAWIMSKNSIDRDKYKNYVKIFNKILKVAQSNYYTHIFDTKTNSTKKLWKELNNLCYFGSRCSSHQSKIAKLVINGNVISESSCMAEEFNRYFCNVGANLASSLPPCGSNSNFNDYLPPSLINSFMCDNITHLEINEIL